MKINIAFIKSAFSEPDGTASSARVMIGMLVCFVLGVGISFCIATHLHKITVNDFNNYLTAAGTFLASSCGPLYLINKGADVFKNKGQ